MGKLTQKYEILALFRIKYLLTGTTFQIFNLLVVTMLRLQILKDLQITMKSLF